MPTREELKEGLVYSYTHQNRIAAIVEIRCQTDFAARTDVLKTLAKELAMQVAATDPADVRELMQQEWIKDPTWTVGARVSYAEADLKESVVVANIRRLELCQNE